MLTGLTKKVSYTCPLSHQLSNTSLSCRQSDITCTQPKLLSKTGFFFFLFSFVPFALSLTIENEYLTIIGYDSVRNQS